MMKTITRCPMIALQKEKDEEKMHEENHHGHNHKKSFIRKAFDEKYNETKLKLL